jgi:glyoxylase-like metal-dependent hydrolase (beta-lactamase superfamily II)
MRDTLPPFVEALGHGIHAIDTGFDRDRFDAAYLLLHGGRAAFIDTGTHFAVPRLLTALEVLGVARSAVDWVIPTHVHLDHAGGAGRLMQELPAARLLVHPRGARHMVDPGTLWQGALAVYGEQEMARAYGAIVAVPAERVRSSHDGMTLSLAGRDLLFVDTPGHARHHHCVWDGRSRGWFAGDTFGLSYREFDTAQGAWIIPASTPVQFDPDALRASVVRLLSFTPECIYLTHYGRVADVARLGAAVLRMLQRTVELGLAERGAADRDAALERGLLAIYHHSLVAHGCTFDEATIARMLRFDVELNARGIAAWLDRS